MNSEDLSRSGFSEWQLFNRQAKKVLLRQVPKSFGVYAIRRGTQFSRVRGSSDILYIGSATNQAGLHIRLRQYFSPGPTQRTNKRILALVAESGSYQVAWLLADTIPKAKALEQEILEGYWQEHGELPPENLRR
jgi:hypothetical protein